MKLTNKIKLNYNSPRVGQLLSSLNIYKAGHGIWVGNSSIMLDSVDTQYQLGIEASQWYAFYTDIKSAEEVVPTLNKFLLFLCEVYLDINSEEGN